jgi:disulfide bond formation protein DsbB
VNRSTGSTSLTEDLASGDRGQAWLLLFAGWAVALISTSGALFIGEIMGQTPYLLCWYQLEQ